MSLNYSVVHCLMPMVCSRRLRLPVAAATIALVVLADVSGNCRAIAAEDVVIPWSKFSFSADEGCQWVPDNNFGLDSIRHTDNYLAAPQPGEDWTQWLAKLRSYRAAVRDLLHAADGSLIDLRYDGVRAWVRTGRSWAFAADLFPGESVVVRGEARWHGGNDRLCLAFDWCGRPGGADGVWGGWSTVVDSAAVLRDGQWHPFQITVKVPKFDTAKFLARPILGMDETFDKSPGRVAIRNLEIVAPHSDQREARLATLRRMLLKSTSFDDVLYRRNDLRWAAGNFVCGFIFIYDRSFWDPNNREYRVGPLCEDAVREFGGYDSVILWQAYPRLGADRRNQFDFFRDMPGGLAGLKSAVCEFHRHGVKVFIPYNPWDIGTRRESESDQMVLAHIVAATESDGLFLDTLHGSPTGLRAAVDAAQPGAIFEPELTPSVLQIQECNSSWAQWDFSEMIGVSRLKWIEPRHMQHAVSRWDKSHQNELAAAWLNGSGVMVWENIFGSWNPWNAEDRATLRRMAPVLRHFADHFAYGQWMPFYPTATPGAYTSCWDRDGTRLWTLVRLSGDTKQPIAIEVEDSNADYFDLWSGTKIEPRSTNGKLRLEVPASRYGAIVELPCGVWDARFDRLLVGPQRESQRTIPEPHDDPHMKAKSVIEAAAAPKCDPANAAISDGSEMLKTAGGTFSFYVTHQRRECGCYPEPGTPLDSWNGCKWDGWAHNVEHRVTITMGEYGIEPRPVTNGEFDKFIQSTDYRPDCADNFLKHWGGRQCPTDLRDKPVVYVDLGDARAYAAWAKKRLPTEWEWQRGAEVHGKAFDHAEVFEWTESLRDDGHTRFVMLRGGCRWGASGSGWYFPTGEQPVESHAKFLLFDHGLDRCETIGFRCVKPIPKME